MAILALRLQLRQQVPELVFLCETKLTSQEFESMKRKVNFPNGFGISSGGRRGGIGLLWKDDLEVEVISYNNNLVDILVSTVSGGQNFRFSGFYGFPNVADRERSCSF